MGRFRILILGCCFFLFSGCCIPILQKKFYRTEYGWERPKKNNFKLNDNLQKLSDVLIEGVYVSTNKEQNIFYRFFNNNKFITSGFNTKSNIYEEVNNLDKGFVGYYQIKENSILLEYFSVGAHDCGEYHQYELQMIGDSIVGYQKIKVAGLKGTPDW